MPPAMNAKHEASIGEILEPLFLSVCRINRLLRNKVDVSYDRARNEIVVALEKARQAAAEESRLMRQFEQVELPMIAFIDGIMTCLPVEWAGKWASNRMASELKQEVAADERFFEILDDCMRDNTKEATERLQIFHTCISLGYTGPHYDDQLILRSKLMQMSQRLKVADLTGEPTDLIAPDVYRYTDTSAMQIPVSRSLTPILICFAVVMVTLLAINLYLFSHDSDELYGILKSVKLSAESQHSSVSK